MSARYAEFEPPPELADHVHCFWIFEGEDAAEDQRIAPDGRAELILHYGAPYLERSTDGELGAQPAAVFAGQLTRPLAIRAQDRAGVVGVRFKPAGAWAYLQADQAAFVDRRVALHELKTGAVKVMRRIEAAASDPARLAAAASHVWEEVRHRADFRDLAVEACVEALYRAEGRLETEALAAIANLTPRTLQRRFARVVGTSPRTLAAIVRFRRVFEALQEASTANWSGAAQAAGYFDHPQMARDFRRFLGCTPSEFVAGRPGLAAELADVANLQGRALRTV